MTRGSDGEPGPSPLDEPRKSAGRGGALGRTLRWIGLGVLALVAALAIALAIAHEPRPEGRPGARAEALAERMERAIDRQAWERTGAVRFRFAGMHDHLWDRTRGVARVRWDDREALIFVDGARGRAYRGGREVRGDEARSILDDAHAHFVNDSFWLCAPAKLRDPGVVLSAVDTREGEALLASYTSGGRTPGDAYLWILDDDGLPRAWRMWVSVLPVGGVEASWEGWTSLSTGARVATRHRGPLGLSFELTDVQGAATLAELEDPDPFAPLFPQDER